ncbi:MAG: hypothetical protein GXO73_10255 [Calditrichaeota bacterium]|nr:hypothetical protein [Calditrichota bacterium]
MAQVAEIIDPGHYRVYGQDLGQITVLTGRDYRAYGQETTVSTGRIYRVYGQGLE